MKMLSNYWSIVLLVGIVSSMIVGVNQYKMSVQELRIRKRFSNRAFSLVGKIFGVAVAIMAAFESTAGIIQVLDKYLGGVKNDAWSVLVFPIAVAMIAIVVWAVVAIVGLLVSQLKKHCLRSVRKDVVKQRRMRKGGHAEQQYAPRASKSFRNIESFEEHRRRRIG